MTKQDTEYICQILDRCYFALTMQDWGGNRTELAYNCSELRLKHLNKVCQDENSIS